MSTHPQIVVPPQDQRNWAMAAHLTALSVFIGVPLGNVIGPLVVWLMKKDTMTFVDDHGRDALNFNISVSVYAIGCLLLAIVIVGFFMLAALLIFHLIVTVKAGIAASKGEPWSYPLSIRWVGR